MFTVKKELNLSVVDLYDVTKYDGDGLYLVDDGFMYYLVSVQNQATAYIAIPRENIVKHKQMIGEGGIDLLQRQLAELNKAIKDLSEVKTIQSNSNDINISDLTKLIAVAQKPELIK